MTAKNKKFREKKNFSPERSVSQTHAVLSVCSPRWAAPIVTAVLHLTWTAVRREWLPFSLPFSFPSFPSSRTAPLPQISPPTATCAHEDALLLNYVENRYQATRGRVCWFPVAFERFFSCCCVLWGIFNKEMFHWRAQWEEVWWGGGCREIETG